MSCKHCKDIQEHGHSHEHHHNHSGSKKALIINLAILGLAILLTGLYYVDYGNRAVNITLAVIAYIILVYDIVINVFKALRSKEFFDENFLMLIATVGAMAIQNYPEACLVLIFYKIGEMLEDYATDKANKSIVNLVQNMPLYAHKVDGDELLELEPEAVEIGDILEVRPGEKIALDGELVSEAATFDQSSLTGESLPVEVSAGAPVYSGSINLDKVIRFRVTKKFSDSTLTTIMNLITSEEKNKSKQERFITRFSKVYTPIVCLLAVVIFLINAGVNGFSDLRSPLYNALNILIISCPCSLVISVPLTFFMGIGKASRYGVLIKGGLALEQIGKAKTFCFDKTGTITAGKFALINQVQDEALSIAASLENNISHPIAASIVRAASERNLSLKKVDNFTNYAGLGISGNIEGKTYFLGSAKLMAEHEIRFDKISSSYLVNYLAVDGVVIANFICADEIKSSSAEAIDLLKKDGVKNAVMLSGDNDDICQAIAKEVGITQVKSSLLPQEKVEYVSHFKSSEKKSLVAFVGDGINDSPSLIAADLGIAMGGLGSQAAIESADIVIMNDDLKKVSLTRKLSKKVMLLIIENITFILLFKLAIIILASFNISNMILSIISDVGVMLLAILNSLRVMLFKDNKI